MITRDNLKECFESITLQDVKQLEQEQGDFIAMTLSVFNAGGVVTVERGDWNEETNQEQAESGQIYCNCDEFLRLYEESGANNEFLDEICL